MTPILPRSIGGRMLALSASATLLALAISGVFMTGVLERFVTLGIDQRLDAQISLLASCVNQDGQIDRARLGQLDGVLDAGRGWRWRIEARGQIIGSEDFPELDPRPDDRGHDNHLRPPNPRPYEGRDHDGRPVHARQLTLPSATAKILITATAPRDMIERPIRGAMTPLLILLALLGGLLGASSFLQIRLGLRPVRQLRDDVAAIRAGHQRALSEEQPEELRPLAIELNALTTDNAAALATARASAANLAHALKTPIAALALEVRDHPDLSRQIERIDETIRHHLSRARARVVDRHAITMLAPAATDLAATIDLLRPDDDIAVLVEIAPDLAVAVDPSDLDEMLGNLIDNAARHARSQVKINARNQGRLIHISVADDGAGIPVENWGKALLPGVRLDERGDGHGFGLTIARELAELYGGVLALDETERAGARITITLPQARSDGR